MPGTHGPPGGGPPRGIYVDTVAARFERSREAHTKAVEALVPELIASAVAEVADVLQGATSLEVLGETNEDGLDILRIQRVRDAAGHMLYDVDAGHTDCAVENRIDHVGSETSTSSLTSRTGATSGPTFSRCPEDLTRADRVLGTAGGSSSRVDSTHDERAS